MDSSKKSSSFVSTICNTKMMKCFILAYKNGNKKGYTTLSALFEDNSKEDLGVSKHTLYRFDFASKKYENERCVIEVIKLRTRGDIIRGRNKS
jgi:hypothetical protein